MLVLQVGVNSMVGNIAMLLGSNEMEPTPLQIRLSDLADLMAQYATKAAIFTFIILFTILIYKTGSGDQCLLCLDFFQEIIEIIMITIGIMVVAIP
jgi:Ca2+-transporting ATPase